MKSLLETNFIESDHDKQEFERTIVLLRLKTELKQVIMEYLNLPYALYMPSKCMIENGHNSFNEAMLSLQIVLSTLFLQYLTECSHNNILQ